MRSPKNQHQSRRSLLAQALGASCLGGSLLEQAFVRAAQARAQAATTQQPVLFNIERVAQGVYAAIALPQTIINSNAVIFEREADLLIVDAHSKPSAAAALAAQLKSEITAKPIRYIVNTHFHWDHTQGDPGYRRIAPHAQFVSSTMTRSLLSELGKVRAKASVDITASAIDGYHRRLDLAKTPQEKAELTRTVAEANAYISEMRDYNPELPDITFDESLVLHDKADDIHLAFRGRGHTAGDVVVFSPQRRVIATGDLLHGWFPFIGDGYPREWPKTLAAVKDLPFQTVIGGHGRVQQGRKPLEQMSSYISELTEAVEAGKRKGQTKEELQSLITPTTIHSLDADYREFLVSQSTNRTLTPEKILAAGVRTNVGDIYVRLD